LGGEMEKPVCQKCAAEFEKTQINNSIFCPACQAKTNIKLYEILAAMFLVFGLCCIGLFIPFLFMPLANGADGAGQYILSNKKGGVIRFTSTSLLITNLFVGFTIVGFLVLAAYFKEKHELLKNNSQNSKKTETHKM